MAEFLQSDPPPSSEDKALLAEIGALADHIRHARAELAALRAHDLTSERFQSATDELDAVVIATEEATGSIMDACEDIEASVADGDPTIADDVTQQVTRIYEACSFQDITGQRITKVVGTLKHIETRVNAIVDRFAVSGDQAHSVDSAASARAADAHAADAEDPEADLLNGPQMPGDGVDQDEIDRLMNGTGA